MTATRRSAPKCQLADCDAEAVETADHPEYGTVQVCATCARLWEGDG